MRTHPRFWLVLLLIGALVAAPGAAVELEDESTFTDELDDGEVEEEEEELEEVSLYLHGSQRYGELELADVALGAYMRMSPNEPDGGEEKSMQVVNYLAGPNARCSGNWLLPTWEAWITGTVKGDVTVTLETLAHPGANVDVQLYTGEGCNEDYVEPAAHQLVELESGRVTTEVVFEDMEFDVGGQFILMVRATRGPAAELEPNPSQARIFYDATSALSKVEFECLPRPNRESCVLG